MLAARQVGLGFTLTPQQRKGARAASGRSTVGEAEAPGRVILGCALYSIRPPGENTIPPPREPCYLVNDRSGREPEAWAVAVFPHTTQPAATGLPGDPAGMSEQREAGPRHT